MSACFAAASELGRAGAETAVPVEPECVLPEQFFAARAGSARIEGERRLMLAVLEDAVRCFQQHAHSKEAAGRRLFLEAARWFSRRDADDLFSFASICHVLGVDGGRLRRRLWRWYRQETQQGGAPRVALRSRVRAGRRHRILPRRRRRRS